MTKTYSTITLMILAILAVGTFVYSVSQNVDSAGYIPAHIQTATTTAVGPQEVKTLFADETSPICKSRVISTTGSAILISFDDVTGFGSTTLAANAGHVQPASTTVAYDSALFGCGLVSAYGYSSSTITISSF